MFKKIKMLITGIILSLIAFAIFLLKKSKKNKINDPDVLFWETINARSEFIKEKKVSNEKRIKKMSRDVLINDIRKRI